jgi:hypothetical protein
MIVYIGFLFVHEFCKLKRPFFGIQNYLWNKIHIGQDPDPEKARLGLISPGFGKISSPIRTKIIRIRNSAFQYTVP